MPKGFRETEAQFQGAIIDMARMYGWRLHHQRPGLTSHGWRSSIEGDPGWLDLVLCRPPRLIIAEVKTERGKLSKDQQIWLEQLELVRQINAYLWKPRDFDQIHQLLKR